MNYVLSYKFYLNTFSLLINILIKTPCKKIKQGVCLVSAIFYLVKNC